MWLKDYNWQALLDKKLQAPYVPEQSDDNFDAKQANGADPWKEERFGYPEDSEENLL